MDKLKYKEPISAELATGPYAEKLNWLCRQAKNLDKKYGPSEAKFAQVGHIWRK